MKSVSSHLTKSRVLIADDALTHYRSESRERLAIPVDSFHYRAAVAICAYYASGMEGSPRRKILPLRENRPDSHSAVARIGLESDP